DDFAKPVAHTLRSVSNRERCELVAIARQADVTRELWPPPAGKAVEAGRSKCARDLPRPVGANIHEHDYVAIFHARGLATPRHNGGGLHELVVLAAGIGSFESLAR